LSGRGVLERGPAGIRARGSPGQVVVGRPDCGDQQKCSALHPYKHASILLRGNKQSESCHSYNVKVLFSKHPRTDEFEKAALPHLPDLYRAAARLLGDSTRAADVVQEVYLPAWKSFDRFEAGTNCRAWWYKSLVNTCHHYRRKWFNVRMGKESEEGLEQAVAGAPP